MRHSDVILKKDEIINVNNTHKDKKNIYFLK